MGRLPRPPHLPRHLLRSGILARSAPHEEGPSASGIPQSTSPSPSRHPRNLSRLTLALQFLVRRQYNAQWGPRPQFTPQYVPQEGYYGMNAYPPPPPMYNANYPQPPQYEPSKADGAAPPPPQAHVNPNPNPFADENGSSSQQENGVTEPGQAHTESRRWRFGRK